MTDTLDPPGPAASDEPPELRPYSGVEYVFEPDRSTVPPIRQYLEDCWERRQFVFTMAKADLRGPRSRTGLGELWAIMDPLFQAGIYWFLISTIRGSGDAVEDTERLTILISGIFFFTFTTTVVSGGGRSIIRNKSLMLNSTFPRLLLPATEVYKGLLDLGPALAVYGVIHVLLGGAIGPGLFMIPLLLVLQILISTGLGLVFATLTVFVADMTKVLEYVMRILFFATPILYPVAMLPGLAQTILQLNPFFALFACYQACITGGVPSPLHLFQAVVWAGVLITVGFRLFVSRERGFALRL